MKRAVLFDFDGVIVDSEPAHLIAFNKTLKKYNVAISEDRWENEFVGIPSLKIMAIVAKENDLEENIFELLVEKKRIFKEYLQEKGVPLKKGLIGFLKFLKKKNVRIAIGSSSRTATILHILEENKIRDYFEFINGIESVKYEKPEPEVYLLCSKQLKVKPKDCIVIEDSVHGAMAAKRAKMDFVVMNSPNNKKIKTRYRINNFKEFPIEIFE